MNLGNRYSQHSFSQVPQVNMARSKFDRSHAVKDTMDFDYLTPIFVDEVLPGDTMNLNVKSFCRLATQVVPVLDNMYIDFFFFFVPNRLVWSNWEKFNGAQENPGDSISYVVPKIVPAAPVTVGSIFDKFGIVTDVTLTYAGFNAMPFRAYNLIWNKWFRDENLQNSVTVTLTDGPETGSSYALLKRGKRHDYFTSALPYPQKGATTVTLPIGTSAPVTRVASAANGWRAFNVSTDTNAANGTISTAGSALTTISATSVTFDPRGGLIADLSAATGASINLFRQAIMVQSLLELDARGGTRYTEILKAHFGVVSPDQRLQRPEFLSGGTINITQHPVAQTSEKGTTPQANLAAFSTASNMGNNIGFSKSFVEHGFVIGLACARADVTYQQGINKMWTRNTRYDYFWPKLQELGEQTILKGEIYVGGTSADADAWGYQERYAEYRYKPSEIRGQFRSTYSSSLDVWHLAEEFGSAPSLNATFIEQNTPIERVLEVAASYPHLLCDYWFDLKHARPIMTYGVPATLGRF